MHPIQEKLLKVSQEVNIRNEKYRRIGKLINESHPQKIKHHLAQLEKKGLIYRDKKSGFIKVVSPGKIRKTKLFSLPVLGSANAGPAEILAHENVEGFLRISSKILGRNSSKGLFVLRAAGNSLNRAESIRGGIVEDGDYVVIDGNNRTPNIGQYVLSIIDDSANLKRYYRDRKTGQIILSSESTVDIPPICIHPSDFSNYMIGGVIVGVIKRPRFKN